MKTVLVTLLLLFAAGAALADEAQCRANAGTYLTGRVVAGPTFRGGRPLNGVELSHTHVTLQADQDGRAYDVAIDNVFADGYDQASRGIPAPLAAIRTGDRLELCGKLYTQGGPGIDWVHTNCGKRPTPAKPDGWIKIIAASGVAGPNIEAASKYCRLWR